MLVEEDGGGKMEEKKKREKEKNLTRNENSLAVDARRSLHTELDDGISFASFSPSLWSFA